MCIDEVLCQATKPTTDLEENVWLLLPRVSAPIVPPYMPIFDCYDGWSEGYPYLINDAICGESEGIRDMFFCRDPVQCSMHAPTYNDVMFQHHTWANYDEHIRGN